jgi:hypothetical protein
MDEYFTSYNHGRPDQTLGIVPYNNYVEYVAESVEILTK